MGTTRLVPHQVQLAVDREHLTVGRSVADIQFSPLLFLLILKTTIGKGSQCGILFKHAQGISFAQ